MAPEPGPKPRSVDFHGLSVALALRRVAQELHTSRVRGETRLVLITGQGFGNQRGEPVLRQALESFLKSPAGRNLGVRQVTRVHRGGALELSL